MELSDDHGSEPAIGACWSSSWLEIDQARIDLFARATDDMDPMHVDPEWCGQNSPYGMPIAFGFLTLSMLTSLAREAIPWPGGAYALNYGFERVRLLSPVRVGAKIQGSFELVSIEPRPPGALYRFNATVNVETQSKPALVADWLTIVVPERTAADQSD